MSGLIEIARYRLRAGGALHRAGERREVEGVLLRVDGGFACLQPWPEFGHAPLDEQCAILREGGSTPLIERALACAAEDGLARREGRSLFEGLSVPPSHATLTDPRRQAEAAWRAGFRVWKAKCGCSPEDREMLAGCAHRWPGVRWRLDFNELPEEPALRGWWSGVPGDLRERIDFLEDPVAFDPAVWRRLAEDLEVDLAVDRAAGVAANADAAVLVLKPAWEDAPRMAERWDGRVVVTSAMDHPLGQAWAAREAAEIAASREVDVCGLRTEHLFERSELSNEFGEWKPRLHPPGGTGLGFDELIDNLDWKPL